MRYEEEEKRLMNDWWDPVVRSVGRLVGGGLHRHVRTYSFLCKVVWQGSG